MANELIDSSQFIFYASSNGNINIQVIVQDENVWVTQKGMSEIFNISRSTITEHLGNIFKSGELEENSVCRKIRHTATDGKSYDTNYYNLDAILSVGYRVNSAQATQFRKWANGVLREYLIKGFALDDDRLKQGSKLFDKDYFDDLIERIREIRASERRLYQKITDLYADASIDYDVNSPITKEFYATVQNKFHFAIHGHTAPELIIERADANKPHMGLTSWKNEKRGGKVLKSDVLIAKNYLKEEEIKELNLLIDQYLSFAENMAKRGRIMTMSDWAKKLDEFLKFNEYGLLPNAGKVSTDEAKGKASKEFEKFRVIQDKEFVSDFDKAVEEIKSTGKLPKKLRK
ncbi:MAG: virulence RhuM family protein [Campylobacteraceae bacterium]|jgi:hypothetical protein|nr:virulence RhuM family protein [Campylobacteraceae bacterium]